MYPGPDDVLDQRRLAKLASEPQHRDSHGVSELVSELVPDLFQQLLSADDGAISDHEDLEHEAGVTLVPLSLYFTGGRAKVELALARGKRTYDKRQDLAQRDAAREVQRAHRRRG